MPGPISKTASSFPIDPAGRQHPSVNRPRSVAESPADSNLKVACEDMEALFIHHMLTEMRKTVAKSGLIDGGRSEEIYTSLMDAELAKEMARSGGLGLSAILQEQLGGLTDQLRRPLRKR